MTSPARVHRERLDRVLMVQGLVPSREAAARTVLAGRVLIDGIMVDKPAKLVPLDADRDRTACVVRQSIR